MGGLVVNMLVAGLVLAGNVQAGGEKAKVDPENAVWAVKLSDVYSGKRRRRFFTRCP